MNLVEHAVRIILLEEMLGTKSANPDLVREFIASRRPEGLDEAEIEAIQPIEEELQKAATVFPRTGGGAPFLYDYQIKGFFKDACAALRRVETSISQGVTAYKKIIDGLIFVLPREIEVLLPENATVTWCERPLRAQTAQGERVALVRSEAVPAGSALAFRIGFIAPTVKDGKKALDLLELVEEWFDYGAFRGLGQWRNSGKGRFSYVIRSC